MYRLTRGMMCLGAAPSRYISIGWKDNTDPLAGGVTLWSMPMDGRLQRWTAGVKERLARLKQSTSVATSGAV